MGAELTTLELMKLSRIKAVPTMMWSGWLVVTLGVLLATLDIVTGAPSPKGARLSQSINASFFLVFAVPFVLVGLPLGTVRFLQSVRLLPVLWIRERDAGLVFAGAFDLMIGGGHLVATDEIKAVTSQPAHGYQKLMGKVVMYQWRIETSRKTYSWLSPRDLVPDATERLRESLELRVNGTTP